jgi:D-alanyl-D-alanine carboxypeptidase
MKPFLFIALLGLVLTGCTQVPMSDANMAVGLASSKKSTGKPTGRSSKERSAEANSKYVAPRALNEFTNTLNADGRDWRRHGVYIETLDSAEPVAMMNEDSLFNPASVIKLATTLAALNKLGPNYRFHTGDLVLYSGRDPSFSISDAKRAGDALRNFGVRRVNGSLVVIGDFDCNHNSQTSVSAGLFERHSGVAFRDPACLAGDCW